MIRVLRVDSQASLQLSLVRSSRPFCAHHRGSWPTITSTSGAGQSTSTGRSPAAGEVPSALPRWPCLATPSSSLPHLPDIFGLACCPSPCSLPFSLPQQGVSRWPFPQGRGPAPPRASAPGNCRHIPQQSQEAALPDYQVGSGGRGLLGRLCEAQALGSTWRTRMPRVC